MFVIFHYDFCYDENGQKNQVAKKKIGDLNTVIINNEKKIVVLMPQS